MIYNVANTYDVGRPIERVVDSDGNSYKKDLLEVDTETGRIKRYARGSAGEPVDGSDGSLVTEVIRVRAPLVVFFKSQEE